MSGMVIMGGDFTSAIIKDCNLTGFRIYFFLVFLFSFFSKKSFFFFLRAQFTACTFNDFDFSDFDLKNVRFRTCDMLG